VSKTWARIFYLSQPFFTYPRPKALIIVTGFHIQLDA
jgi:hypothetical protein